ncbi:MAG: hypothetical protein EZS28_039000 [Streblomastix strix]|uniref:Uncharacterized protein n=1 Tax=Streblomastix strix TaxID=222440 RepID=A0A5J4U5A1_9EUKA|nr:MAG: hypothetical protein EZS28_039000 [Streblomastix strix]
MLRRSCIQLWDRVQGLLLDTELCKLITGKPAADRRAAVTDDCEHVPPELGDRSTGLDQVIATPEKVPLNVMTVVRALQVELLSGKENVTTLLTTIGKTNIDRETKLDCNYEIQFLHVSKTIRHKLQGKYDACADGHEGTREPAEDSTVNSNTSWTEGKRQASVDSLRTRIVGFTGELDQELKKLAAQQIIDLIKSKPEIIPPECAQNLARKPTLEI